METGTDVGIGKTVTYESDSPLEANKLGDFIVENHQIKSLRVVVRHPAGTHKEYLLGPEALHRMRTRMHAFNQHRYDQEGFSATERQIDWDLDGWDGDTGVKN